MVDDEVGKCTKWTVNMEGDKGPPKFNAGLHKVKSRSQN
jgi:hypothetical protein